MKQKRQGGFFHPISRVVFCVLAIFALSFYAKAEAACMEYKTADLSEYILQVGGLGINDNTTQASAVYIDGEDVLYGVSGISDASSAEMVILNALQNKSASISVKGYGLSSDAVSQLYSRIVNQHPELFYVEGASWSHSGGIVYDIFPSYDHSYTDADINAFNQRVNQIIAGVDSSWPTMEKILYLHDYLVTNVEYDATYSRYNAYNALVEGSSVCQGYSLAFTCLMNNIGVNSDVITSRDLDHAWNLVELDGEYFYVDATWDDPLGAGVTYCAHDNFMVSNSRFVEEGHYTTDWQGNITGINVYQGITSSSRYDNFFWKDMECAIPLVGTKAGYLTEGNMNIYDFATGTTNSYSRVQGTWPYGQYGYFADDFCAMAAYQGAFYYTTPRDIYRMDSNGSSTKVYTLSSSEWASGAIYGLRVSGRNLNYILKTEPYGDATGTGTFHVNTPVEDFVTRMYQQCLSRNPDQVGFEDWVSQLEARRIDGATIAQKFVFSQELLSRNLSNGEFVNVLYRSMMGREADSVGYADWVSRLGCSNKTRSEVTKSFVESAEFTNICSSYGIVRGNYETVGDIERFVTRFYTIILERNAEQTGLYYWVDNLKMQHVNGAQIAQQFFFSTEFVNKNVSNDKYVELLYNTLMGRPSDVMGKKDWVTKLNKNYMTRFDVLKAFIESNEFTGICNTYGITRGSL